MAIVTEISWDDMLDGKPLPEHPARTAWRDAVSEIAEKAKQTLPECNGRVDAAVKIVLAGDIDLQADGTARVASQSNSQIAYHLVNGICDCKDYSKAPSNWCKHRIAAGIQKRVYALAKTKQAQLDSASNGTSQPPTEQSQGQPTPDAPVSASALPEAPASANCHITIEGRQVQVTLRDLDETRLLTRLVALLQQYPVAQPPTPPPTQGTMQPTQDESPYCHAHKAVLKRYERNGQVWYSHKTADGRWCRGQ